MGDAFKGPKLKIKWAYEHVDKIETVVEGAFGHDVYALVEDVEPNSGDRILKVKFVGTIPDDLLMLTAHTVYHLRSALDQMAVALVISGSGAGADTSGTYFPFAGDINEFMSKGTQRKVKGMSPAVIDLMMGLKAYKGGNDLLWGLSRLSNVDKHIKLVPTGAIGNWSRISDMQIQNGKVGILITGEKRLDKGIPISNLGRDGTYSFAPGSKHNIHMTGTIAFGEVDVFENKPIVATLFNLTQLVERIVTMFEGHV